jgi:hypothetical protein
MQHHPAVMAAEELVRRHRVQDMAELVEAGQHKHEV